MRLHVNAKSSRLVVDLCKIRQSWIHFTRHRLVKVVASDLEWWFHGPPRCQHMMRMLTGESSHSEFRFEPRSIEVVGDCVIAEGGKERKCNGFMSGLAKTVSYSHYTVQGVL
ncbi:Wound-induced protein, Wun1 [Corchorus capsularis]|uniref:Wound-induced protein, Wun1 n=1 Tax=Corchorus capsularis TaxID=210143 RepID=A0A1R3IQR9_COCAP|nr:Wound-induced protein, Wun1 [Corchorus capsularis]